MFDGRMHRCYYKGVYRVRQNIISLKRERDCWKKWSEKEFLETYLHELAHWATWLGASKYQRRKMHIAYHESEKNTPHDKRFIEKIAFWICGYF
jgi:hypothetical protein